ncbi:uncharacterized protein AKAME5_000143000 [Lates japonicus]|uniref:Uncharacterized protein n=1 Tax=Lates japonicus TaxID=270547 RepID=A0AAD3QWP4_LATJO|nr:uncharacterized protein AKAME5_000143000 [Lates japonicus]
MLNRQNSLRAVEGLAAWLRQAVLWVPAAANLCTSIPPQVHAAHWCVRGARGGLSDRGGDAVPPHEGSKIDVPFWLYPLPQPASPPPPDPVIPSSPLQLITPSSPICRRSPALSTCSLPSSHSRSLPAGKRDFSPSSPVSLLIGSDGFRCILGLQLGPGLGGGVVRGGAGLCCHGVRVSGLTPQVAYRLTADRPAICCLKHL